MRILLALFLVFTISTGALATTTTYNFSYNLAGNNGDASFTVNDFDKYSTSDMPPVYNTISRATGTNNVDASITYRPATQYDYKLSGVAVVDNYYADTKLYARNSFIGFISESWNSPPNLIPYPTKSESFSILALLNPDNGPYHGTFSQNYWTNMVVKNSNSFSSQYSSMYTDANGQYHFAQLTGSASLVSIANTFSQNLNTGNTPNEPLMPSSEFISITNNNIQNSFHFTDINALKDAIIYIDPIIAIGYKFIVGGGGLVTGVDLPALAGSDYKFFDDNGNIISGKWNGNFFDFDTDEGIFTLKGIPISAGLDPSDPMAFTAGLKFSNTGTYSVAMTALTMNTSPAGPSSPTAATPEPATMVLTGLGFVGALVARRKAKHSS